LFSRHSFSDVLRVRLGSPKKQTFGNFKAGNFDVATDTLKGKWHGQITSKFRVFDLNWSYNRKIGGINNIRSLLRILPPASDVSFAAPVVEEAPAH